MSVTTTFKWLGGQVLNAVLGDVDDRLRQGGAAWLAMSRSLAPVKTGRLREEEGYTVANGVLSLNMGAPYDVFQEFGTRTLYPRPHVRPAMAAIGRVWGGEIEMNFNALSSAQWQGIFAYQGGFVVPSGIQPRPLTRAQHAHVQKHLLPTSRRLHRGNVARAKFRVRRFP